MQDLDLNIRHGAYLPHWTKDGAVYHVRFRLADSLPQEKLKMISDERKGFMNRIKNRKPTKYELKRIDELFSESVEGFLDAGYGACWLNRNDVAKIATSTLTFFDQDHYDLYAWCIMPNHIHVVVKPDGNYQLQNIVKSWKSFIAKSSNKIIGRTGTFWQREYYDHIIRKEERIETVIDYVWKNPDKAGLKNWPWRWKSI